MGAQAPGRGPGGARPSRAGNAWQHGGRAFACLPAEARQLIEALRVAERTGHAPPFVLAERATLAMTHGRENLTMFMRGMALYRRYLRLRMASL